MWLLISIVGLIVLVVALIQVPAIQTRIVKFATTYVSNKTKTRVEIGKISIGFPKTVVIEGLYLEDLKKDTLLYAGKISVSVALLGLINQEIHLRSVALEDATVNLNRLGSDTLLNFDFLIKAFSDTTAKKKPVTATPSAWTFSVDKVNIEKLRFRFTDDYGGIRVAAKLAELSLQVEALDFKQSIYSIDKLALDNLSGSVLLTESRIPKTNDPPPDLLPVITANNIEITNAQLRFVDSTSKMFISAGINELGLKGALLDIQGQMVVVDAVSLSKSDLRYTQNALPTSDTIDVVTLAEPSNDDWKVNVNHIQIEDNALAFNIENVPQTKNVFNAFHQQHTHVSLIATGFAYATDNIEVQVKNFMALDQNNFAIRSFETDFSMDEHIMTAKNLKASTTNSLIDGDFEMHYGSLASIADSLPFLFVRAAIKTARVKTADILYFSPALAAQTFFKNTENITTLSGFVVGTINNLNAKELSIRTGTNTLLKTDCAIVGLPDAKTAHFDFPNLRISTGKKDLQMILDTLIPATIELPENIQMAIVFKGRLNSFDSRVDMKSTYGSAQIVASIDPQENFAANAIFNNFDLGPLLKDTKLYGPVSLTATTHGRGLNKDSIKAHIVIDASALYLNEYTYHNLVAEGDLTGQSFEGDIKLDDEHAVFDCKAKVNFRPGQEEYQIQLNLAAADLKALHLTTMDLRIGMFVASDLTGGSKTALKGTAAITKLIVLHEGKTYTLDSAFIASFNDPDRSEAALNAALISIKYDGIMSPIALPAALQHFTNNYFSLFKGDSTATATELQPFSFEVKLRNHPLFSEVFFPGLTEFEPGLIQGYYDLAAHQLKATASVKNLVYGSSNIRDLVVDVNSDITALTYEISCSSVSNSLIKLDNIRLDGHLADQGLIANLSSTDENQNKKLLIRSQLVMDGSNYKLTFDPAAFYLMNERWDLSPDNYIAFGSQGYLIHNMFLSKADSRIEVSSVNDQFNDDLNIEIANFKLEDLAGIMVKDTLLVQGTVDGKILLKQLNGSYGLIADASIRQLYIREVPIGDLSIKAENPTAERFNVQLNLSGTDNNLSVDGYYIPNGGEQSINMTADIQSLSMTTVQAFSMGALTEASGTITGKLQATGKASMPDVTGELTFNNVIVTPAALNTSLTLSHETIKIKDDGIYFNTFTVLDTKQHPATINGSVKMHRFTDFVFALNVSTKDFLLFNTTAKDNETFYGRMIIDSKIKISGPISLPVVDAKIKVKKGSIFTFAITETDLSTSKGEGVVEFKNPLLTNAIFAEGLKKEKQVSGMTGFDITSVVEIDKQATLRLLIDPTSNDSLVVRGEAALNFSIDRSGKMSLTGTYNVNEGSYVVSLGSMIKRNFKIDPGSTILWNGELLEAAISINAIYSVRAAPIDLVAGQVSNLVEAEQNKYKQRYQFMVLLKLRGALMHPDISFEIQLPPEDKGILGGAVNAKLNMLNEDPSALNKQVFSLLVMGRFVQENPLQSESYGASAMVRTTVGKYLSTQLNQWSSKVVPGIELNFDIQSYDDYQSGEAEGRTQVDIGIKKQLFNERLSVQLGGTVDVEGESAKKNSASNITSDVTVEYKLTKDGRYLLKGFRHNQYDGAIEGQLVETGVGVLYVRDFSTWGELFKSPGNKKDTLKNKDHETHPSK